MGIAEVALSCRRDLGDQWGARSHRLIDGADHGQRFVLDDDGVEPGYGGGFRLGCHRGHRLTDVADLIHGQDIGVFHRPAEVAVIHEVSVSDDGLDPGHRERRCCVQLGDARVGQGAPEDLGDKHPRNDHVAHVSGATGHFVRAVHILQ